MTAGNRLAARTPEILHQWESAVRAAADSTSGEGRLALSDRLPDFLQALATGLRGGESAPRASHEQGPLEQVMLEYTLLREAVIDVLEADGTPLARDDRHAILRAIDAGITQAAARFVELQLQDASRRKDEFLAMLAHELRNPLSAIRSSVELLRLRAGADPARDRPREAIDRQLTHLTRIVDDLFEAARLTRGTLVLRRQRVELESLVRQAVEMVQPHTSRQAQRVVVTVRHRPVWIDADPTRVAQVIDNLLHNAAKFSGHGQRIDVIVDVEQACGVVRVRDRGAGIAPELLPHVFDLSSEGVRWVDGQQSGLGMGLKLVRALVEMHGGTVQSASAGLGQGSEFTIRLPLAPAPPAQAAAEAPPDHAAPLRVLVVDDNVDAAESLAEVLTIHGHDAQAVFGGKAALEAAHAVPPDVVLLDLSMPELDGYTVARRLREHPLLMRARIVALTGYGQERDRKRTAAEGFDGHLTKPVDIEELERLLARYRNRHAG